MAVITFQQALDRLAAFEAATESDVGRRVSTLLGQGLTAAQKAAARANIGAAARDEVVLRRGRQTVFGDVTFERPVAVPAGSIPQDRVTGLPADLAGKLDAADLAGKADADSVVDLTTAQTVAGVKTFSSAPVVPDGSFTQAKVTNLTTALAGKTAPTTWTPTFEGDAWVPNGVDLTETVQDIVGAQLVAGPNASVVYNDTTGQVTIDASLSAIQDANARAGVVYLNDFAGATADDKFAAARTYAMAQTRRPWIEFPPGTTTLNGSYDMWTGMRLRGPAGDAAIGEEVTNGGAVAKIRATGGSGTSSLFKTATTVQYVTVSNLAFHADGDVQIFHSTGNVYGAQFHNLNFYGALHAFGSTASKFLCTYTHFTGYWTVNAMTGGAFHLGGSDGTFWVAGNANINGAAGTAGNGTYQVWMDGMSKSTIGGAYVTCNNGWRGLKVSGASMAFRIIGGEYEGMLHALPCDGNVIRVEGGQVFIAGPYVGHAMGNPLASEHGVVEVAGNATTRVAINGLIYRRNKTTPEVAETVPLVYCSGGKVDVRQAMADGDDSTWTGLPRVQAAGTGALTTDAWATAL